MGDNAMSILSTCINAYLDGKKIVFWGAGAEGSASYMRMQNATHLISYYVDNSSIKQGTTLYDIPIYHPDKLKEESKNIIQIIITAVDYKRICQQLREIGFVDMDIYASTYEDAAVQIPMERLAINSQPRVFKLKDVEQVENMFDEDLSKEIFEKIIRKYEQNIADFTDVYSNEPMYFNDIFQDCMSASEVYVDAGVHTVHTIVDFIFYTKGKYKKIHAFEPDSLSFARLCKELKNLKNVALYDCGIGSSNQEVLFKSQGIGGSKVIKNANHTSGTTKINIVSLDTFLEDAPTFIKMDIEGLEYDALLGASEIIKKHKPKLAISVYHGMDDLVKIPLLINKMVSEYKFFLRHHMPNPTETILYAKI